MGRYGQAAIMAVELIKTEKVKNPIDAWETATCQIFGKGTSMQCKGCPKGAFLGLCEEGLINGIPSGKYTRSHKNKSYAVKAVSILKNNPRKNFTEETLWIEVIGNEYKAYNQQMDVVIALWKKGYIK